MTPERLFSSKSRILDMKDYTIVQEWFHLACQILGVGSVIGRNYFRSTMVGFRTICYLRDLGSADLCNSEMTKESLHSNCSSSNSIYWEEVGDRVNQEFYQIDYCLLYPELLSADNHSNSKVAAQKIDFHREMRTLKDLI